MLYNCSELKSTDVMLQIKNIEIGWDHNTAENLSFDFMVETMKDIHIMQEIIRNYINSYFCIKSKFGYVKKDGKFLLAPEFKYPYEEPIRVIIDRDGNNLSYHMKVLKKEPLKKGVEGLMNIANVWFERREEIQDLC